MKGWRGQQGFYLDLQRSILKWIFWKTQLFQQEVSFQNQWKTMNGAFFSFGQKINKMKHFLLNRALKCAAVGQSSKVCLIRQIMNHFIGQRWTTLGILRVKKLDYWSPSNLKTHKTPCGTTGHLEDIIRSAKQKGGFSEVVNSETEHQSVP